MLRSDYPHVGLLDVRDRTLWIARRTIGLGAWLGVSRRGENRPDRISHARMLRGGTNTTSTANKDRFLCYWYHTPDSPDESALMPLRGQPINKTEAHLLIRVDPTWNYSECAFIPRSETRRIASSLRQQHRWAAMIFAAYANTQPAPPYPLTYHIISERPDDAVPCVERFDPASGQAPPAKPKLGKD